MGYSTINNGVSVLIPVHNEGETIAKTLEGVFSLVLLILIGIGKTESNKEIHLFLPIILKLTVNFLIG